ncbi:MAG TPA: ABC transporter ATP-binding protein [Polyangiaceae bacterium]|nr:ABC transporter ATP-binding protein [Polyangiaceae bacterium]
MTSARASSGRGMHPAPPATAHLRVDRVERRFGDVFALRDVNMSVERGHVAVIIGGSGAGKTTLLKILIGLDRPTRGAVYLDGVDIASLKDRELNEFRKKLGMVFQYSALLDSMNVLDNVAFPLREHTKLKESEIRARVSEKLRALGLPAVEDRYPSELSGGMRKRVALARALMLEPEVLLYDEPTSGLDPITSRRVDDMILETRDKFGVTSVVISHDMASALHIADRVHLLAEGRIVASGAPRDIAQSTHELVRQFLDSSGIAASRLLRDRP